MLATRFERGTPGSRRVAGPISINEPCESPGVLIINPGGGRGRKGACGLCYSIRANLGDRADSAKVATHLGENFQGDGVGGAVLDDVQQEVRRQVSECKVRCLLRCW
ncbi:hypothetical protein MKZ38_005233 [Zalerion maritima]|uniref:Uncharacterized protein n=1 Tax=Zalerion maritima TaxID=339359 RepID=A0AAD5WR37_9PEZI|nr:hypothetical protein MKZ38_005233 [Zalerion maritima]